MPDIVENIGKYQILSKIGAGGMGVVFKALDPRIGRIVAIKTLSAHLDAEPELRKRFNTEARSAGSLSHKNIITIYEMDEDNGHAFLAMEFLEGSELKALITADPPMPLERRLRIMIEICEGLGHAHSMGIIHRDIKPGNIFILKSGLVKILDFGLARLTSSDATKTSFSMGTPSYMSPEQVRGEAVDHRSDIFSAGVLFYELLARTRPFQGDSDFAVIYKIMQGEIKPLDKVAPTLPHELARIVGRAMARDPAARYQHMEEMLAALEAFRSSLEEEKNSLRKEIRQGVARLEILLQTHAELASKAEVTPDELKRRAPDIFVALAGGPKQEDSAYLRGTQLGYLELIDLRDRIRGEFDRLVSFLKVKERVAYRLQDALDLKRVGRLEKALKVTDTILADDPANAEATALRAELMAKIPALGQTQGLQDGRAGMMEGDDAGEETLPIAGVGVHRASTGGTSVSRIIARWGLPRVAAAIGLFIAVLAAAVYFGVTRSAGSGSILITSDPMDAAIEINGQPQGTTRDGRLRLEKLKPGLYTVTARKPGYADQSEPVTIARGENRELSIRLNPAMGELRIIVSQSTVRVLVDGKPSGETGAVNVPSTFKVPAGRHRVSLYKEGFSELGKDLDFSAGSVSEMRETLMPIQVKEGMAALRILASPPEASVLLNGKKVGDTAGGTLTLQNLKPGPAKLLVTKTGYADEERSLTLQEGRVMDQVITLIPRPSVLLISTNVPDATVQIDNTAVGRTDASGRLRLEKQKPEPKVIQVLKDGYDPAFSSINPKPGETLSVDLRLNPRAAAATTSTLNVTSSPSDAEVYVDSRLVGRATPNASIQVAPGTHKIELRKDRYRSQERLLEFRPGEPQALAFVLEEMRGRLEIAVQPDGATATVNGVAYDTATRKQLDLPVGQHTVLLSKAGYRPKEETVTIRDQQTFTLRGTLEKAETTGSTTIPPTGPTLAGAYREDFTSLARWENPAGWLAASGIMRARGTGAALLKDMRYRDYRERFKLRLINGISACWIVRAQDNRNYYMVEINGKGHPDRSKQDTIVFYTYFDGLTKSNESVNLPISIPKDSRSKEAWLDIVMEVKGNRISINAAGMVLSGTNRQEVPLAVFQDQENRFPAGLVGFRVAGREEFEIADLLLQPTS